MPRASGKLPRAVERPLAGWGNYPIEHCTVYRPERLDELATIVADAPEADLVARGLGRSYGDAALNRGRGVVLQQRLNRLLSFDPETGILHCEAAVSLAEIIEHFLPRGFFPPVTPGTKEISVGGAIAADVHGKNHHRDGAISSQLLDFRLMTGTGEVLTCSREENPDLFWATVGGMGLTGLILDAHLRLSRVETAWVHGLTERAPNLDAALDRILDSDRDYAYAVAWIDCLARGRSLGRSVLMRANPARIDELSSKARSAPLSILPARSWLRVPFDLPAAMLNPLNMKIFNGVFYFAHRDSHSITNFESYFYPLDAVRHWNRVYGKRGILQYQVALPARSSREALVEILERVSATGRASFLAVLKSMGPGDAGLLSFPMSGTTLALDFPYTGPDLIDLLHSLDERVLHYGGRVYLAKDCCLRAEHLAAMYPDLDRFREIKSKFDPEQRFSSSLGRRLRIVEPT